MKLHKIANRTWKKAVVTLANERLDLVILDELTYMLSFDHLPEEEVLSAIANLPISQSAVLTGCGGGKSLREIMDTVSEVKEIKQAYRTGITARRGIDY